MQNNMKHLRNSLFEAAVKAVCIRLNSETVAKERSSADNFPFQLFMPLRPETVRLCILGAACAAGEEKRCCASYGTKRDHDADSAIVACGSGGCRFWTNSSRKLGRLRIFAVSLNQRAIIAPSSQVGHRALRIILGHRCRT